MGEIFPESGQVSAPLSNLFDEYIRLFDEPEKAIHSEEKAADNKIDNLKTIIVEATKEMENDRFKPTDGQPSTEPPNNNSMFKGEGSSVSNTMKLSTEGEYPTPIEGENSEPDMGYASTCEGENENTNDEGNQSEYEEEVRHEDLPKGSTSPRSPTPTEQLNDKIPTPPPSPPKTTVQVSVAPPIPPTQPTQPTTTALPPPVSTKPISTTITPLPPPIISPSIITTMTELPAKVNVSNTGANIETETPVTPKPLSPSPLNDSASTLGGDNFEFDSTYYSPYRLPTDKDEEAPVTRQKVQGLDDKLDQLLASSSKYNDVVMKAFLDTAFEQYTNAIDKSTKAVEASSSSSKVNAFVESLSKSLQGEQVKFETVRSDILADNKSLLLLVDSRIENLCANLAMENRLMDALAKKTTTVIIKTEPKVNVASGSSSQEKRKDVSDANDESDEDRETTADVLKRKKRDQELDKNLQVAKEEVERERKKKEEHDALICKKALFPPWTEEGLIKEAIEFPSTYWLEPVASFDCDNSRDSQFDMPITKKAFFSLF
ncbi:uncharacterized protein LOC111893610 [Lactuca sativa]|uniref:uncharacterized protein LOC111893610 n=1 Tax=Lactuca sativa TaxID=4236 RepID=UPI000CD99A01|nr:uncharacterized protein LOC111893610 [Lactuca sativa]